MMMSGFSGNITSSTRRGYLSQRRKVVRNRTFCWEFPSCRNWQGSSFFLFPSDSIQTVDKQFDIIPSPVPSQLVPLTSPKWEGITTQSFGFREEVLPAGWTSQKLTTPFHATFMLHTMSKLQFMTAPTYTLTFIDPTHQNRFRQCLLEPFGKKFNGISMLKMLPWGLGVQRELLVDLRSLKVLIRPRLCLKALLLLMWMLGVLVTRMEMYISWAHGGRRWLCDSYWSHRKNAMVQWEYWLGRQFSSSNCPMARMQLQPPSTQSHRALGSMRWSISWAISVRGGIFWCRGLLTLIIDHNIQGHGGVEDFHEMYWRYPKADSSYWKDKRPDISKISIPTYITASYTSFVHTIGSLHGWLQLSTSEKWLRICPCAGMVWHVGMTRTQQPTWQAFLVSTWKEKIMDGRKLPNSGPLRCDLRRIQCIILWKKISQFLVQNTGNYSSSLSRNWGLRHLPKHPLCHTTPRNIWTMLASPIHFRKDTTGWAFLRRSSMSLAQTSMISIYTFSYVS